MARYNSVDFKIEFDNSSGVLQDMSVYITDAGPMEKDTKPQEITPFGAADETFDGTGVGSVKSITLKGDYDDTATTGPDAIFNDVGCKNTTGGTRTLKYTYGSTKTTSVETIITGYKRVPGVKKLTGLEVTLQPTGAVTEV